MASSSVVKLVVCLAMMAMLLDVPVVEALTCGQVSSSLVACINYIKVGGVVPAACCIGVRSLNRTAKTTADRRAACKCLQSAARIVKGINWKLAAGLPGKCGVHIPYKISPSANCARRNSVNTEHKMLSNGMVKAFSTVN